MIDLHMHTLMSDGCLLPAELARRAVVKGYSALAITDHADDSNIEQLLKQLKDAAARIGEEAGLTVLPGVEITHVAPSRIPAIVARARKLGARIVVGHGETLVEPVAPGTNMAYVKAGVDVLAHPGLVADDVAALAAKKGVHFEITTRSGHSLSNGHVAGIAARRGVKLVINTDSHGPGDLVDDETAARILAGAGLDGKKAFKELQANASEIIRRRGK